MSAWDESHLVNGLCALETKNDHQAVVFVVTEAF